MKYIALLSIVFLAACTPLSNNNDLEMTQDAPTQESLLPEETDAPEATESDVLGIETTNDTNQIKDTKMSDSETTTVQEVILKTSKGDITLKLYPDSAPNTVENFVTKAAEGYYEGLTFHRVEDWVIQGGDPVGNGTGGGQMPTELSSVPFKIGSLGVARGGNIKISNDSQFFICTKDCSWLTGDYTNFGEVTEGMDVALSMEIGDTIDSIEVIE